MKLNFKSKYYLDKALDYAKKEDDKHHSFLDAFFQLINNVSIDDLYNLCELIKNYYKDINLSVYDCYNLTQGLTIKDKLEFNEDVKKIIYMLAYECIENGTTLGNSFSSAWLSHSLFEAKLSGQLAEFLGLDKEKATRLGILHDIGRKQGHSHTHITNGFEFLVDINWGSDALCCLTHSFLGGGRYANNGFADPGFYIDEFGLPHLEEGTDKDDITIFLENYKYTKYDIILNIADLMATSYGIVSPLERINDIATRRKFDIVNRGYFLAEFSNYLVEMLKEMNVTIPLEMNEKIFARKDITLEEISIKFEKISDLFFYEYQKKCTNILDNSRTKILSNQL